MLAQPVIPALESSNVLQVPSWLESELEFEESELEFEVSLSYVRHYFPVLFCLFIYNLLFGIHFFLILRQGFPM